MKGIWRQVVLDVNKRDARGLQNHEVFLSMHGDQVVFDDIFETLMQARRNSSSWMNPRSPKQEIVGCWDIQHLKCNLEGVGANFDV